MVRFRLERGPVPLHHQVYLDLSSALAAREWARGDRLPTERDLAAHYGCSLITVRRALDELAREGRLERTPGRGTFATDPPIVRDISGPAGFADEIRSLGYEPYSIVVSARTEAATLAAARALGIEPGAALHYLERIRGADGLPLLLEQVRLPASRLPGLLDHDFGREESLWDVLRGDYHRRLTRAGALLRRVRERAGQERRAGRSATVGEHPALTPSATRIIART